MNPDIDRFYRTLGSKPIKSCDLLSKGGHGFGFVVLVCSQVPVLEWTFS
jgi:hypothetical protein